MPDAAADFLARHAADLPAAVVIAVSLLAVAAVVLLSGRKRDRPEPVIGHYPCHACGAPYAVAFIRSPREHAARLVCVLPECRVAYGVVKDDGDPVGTLLRAHKAYMRVRSRSTSPRNTGGRRKATGAGAPAPAVSVAVPAIAPPHPDWTGFRALPEAPESALAVAGPVPMPPSPPTNRSDSDTRGGNRP